MPAFGDGEHLTTRFEHATGDALRLFRCEPRDDRCDPLRAALLALLVGLRCRAEVLGHAGERDRRDGIHRHAVAGELECGDHREGGDAGLGCAVVRLADVAVDARHRGRIDDATVDRVTGLLTIAPVRGGEVRWCEGALQVHLDDGVPLLFAHVGHHAVTQDAGVVDDGVQVTEGVDCGLDESLCASPRGDVVAVGDRLATHRLDLVHHLLGR